MVENYILIIPSILLALTIHEYAHAWMANRFGDPTSKMLGRLSLNPFIHLDPIGTLMLFLGVKAAAGILSFLPFGGRR